MSEGDRTPLTYRYERRRAVASGILETAGTTFLLLIAVKWFEAGATAKALVAAGGSAGLLLTPLVVSTVQRFGWPASRAAAALSLAGAVAFLLMAWAPVASVFVAGSVVAMAAASSVIPLLTQIYQENYPEARRGRMYSRTVMIRIGVAALFSELVGRVLSGQLDRFPWLLLVFALASGLAGHSLFRIPSRPLARDEGSHPFRSLRFARQDDLFRRTLVCWMLMGFANLMMLPMRVEYLANPRYGLAMSVGEVAFLVGVIPNAARLVMSPFWGWVFDRVNFFLLRVVLNIGFGIGILSFFASESVTGLILGAIVYGISNAGGDVAWGLWVTKLAPEDKVADYMSVHTFFTGVRGVVAPLAAFHLATRFSLMALGWISVALIAIASLLLLPELKYGRNIAREPSVTEDISD